MAKQAAPTPEPIRLHMLLTPEEAQELDDWQFQHRHRTRTAAIKALMRLGYEASKASAGAGPGGHGGEAASEEPPPEKGLSPANHEPMPQPATPPAPNPPRSPFKPNPPRLSVFSPAMNAARGRLERRLAQVSEDPQAAKAKAQEPKAKSSTKPKLKP